MKIWKSRKRCKHFSSLASPHPSIDADKTSFRALAPSLRFPSFPFPPPFDSFLFFHLHFPIPPRAPPNPSHFSGSPPSPAFFPIFFIHSFTFSSFPPLHFSLFLFPILFTPPPMTTRHLLSLLPSSRIPIISADWVFSSSSLSLDTHLLMASIQSLLDQSLSLTFFPLLPLPSLLFLPSITPSHLSPIPPAIS